MKKVLMLVALLSGYSLYGQIPVKKDIKPVLVAIQVSNLDSSIHFYTKYLGLQLAERKKFEDYHLEIAFLKNKDFELELVKNDSSINKNLVLKEKRATDITGFAKISFQVEEIEQIYNYLKSENIPIIISLRKSTRNKEHQTFIVTDYEGNWIQFTGK